MVSLYQFPFTLSRLIHFSLAVLNPFQTLPHFITPLSISEDRHTFITFDLLSKGAFKSLFGIFHRHEKNNVGRFKSLRG